MEKRRRKYYTKQQELDLAGGPLAIGPQVLVDLLDLSAASFSPVVLTAQPILADGPLSVGTGEGRAPCTASLYHVPSKQNRLALWASRPSNDTCCTDVWEPPARGLPSHINAPIGRANRAHLPPGPSTRQTSPIIASPDPTARSLFVETRSLLAPVKHDDNGPQLLLHERDVRLPARSLQCRGALRA